MLQKQSFDKYFENKNVFLGFENNVLINILKTKRVSRF